MKSGQRLVMKNISQEEIKSMNLGWMWEAGRVVVHVRHIKGEPYDEMIPGKSASLVSATHGRHEGRKVWVYDEFIGAGCIWE